MTISINLPADLERHFQEIVQKDYGGDLPAAIKGFLELHERYGWKEQLCEDVKTIRAEMQRAGGINAEQIDLAVNKYRKKAHFTHA